MLRWENHLIPHILEMIQLMIIIAIYIISVDQSFYILFETITRWTTEL